MTTAKAAKRRRDSYITGEKGTNRVRLYPDPRNGTLMLEYRDEVGAKRRLSLGHADLTRGKIAANELAADLLKHEGPRNSEITLRTLFDKYEREVTPTKTPDVQRHDKRTRALFEACWGNAVVKDLDRTDWDRFTKQRRNGTLRHELDKRKTTGVRDRAIQRDLVFLLAVCNWATTVKEKGRPLLDRNPFKGFPIPVENNPHRPITTEEEFMKLSTAAKELESDAQLYLTLAHETGHRCTAIARLRWSDFDLEKGQVTWRAEHDKLRQEHSIPLTASTIEALKAARRSTARIGDGWVFPSPYDPVKPIARETARLWWRRLEEKAGLERKRGRGWHSLRRKFATDMREEAPAVLCALGGWKDYHTILKCYMRPDEAAMKTALDRRSRVKVG